MYIWRFAVMSEHYSQQKIRRRTKDVKRIEPRFTPLRRPSSDEDSFLDVTSLATLELPVGFTEIMQERDGRETLDPELRESRHARERGESCANSQIGQ